MIYIDLPRISKCSEGLRRKGVIVQKKILKKIGILVAAFALSLQAVMPVSADSILDTVENTETTADYAEDTSYSLLRGNNLNYGTIKINKVSNHEVSVYGISQCHQDCATVYLTLTLERKVNGSYGTYKTWSYTTTNADHLSKNLVVIVPKGYYYRLRGYHAAKDGGIKESTRTLTSGILIN